MGRRINTRPRLVTGHLGNPENFTNGSDYPASRAYSGDNYAERLLKYIPAELVGIYLAARGIIPANQPDSGLILWIVAAVTWLLVPGYLYFSTTRHGLPPLWWQIGLGTIAFPVWVFAIGGRPVDALVWYANHQFVGSLVLMFVTVIFGFKEP